MDNNNTEVAMDGWIRLACAIGAVRSQQYRVAYEIYLKNPTDINRRMCERWENKLRGPVTNLTDDDLAKIREDVAKHGALAFDCSY